MERDAVLEETENLKFMWNRHHPAVLSGYLRRTMKQCQPLFTRRKILEYLAYRNPNKVFLLEEKLQSKIIRPYLTYRKKINSVLPRAPQIYDGLFRVTGRLRRKRLRNTSIERIAIADIGCGAGNYFGGVFLDSGLEDFIDYTGIDLSENVINVCQTQYPRAKYPSAAFELGNILSLPFPDNHFDVVMVNHVFEHLSPKVLQKAVNESARVTKDVAIFNFFYEDDVPEHVIMPRMKYHWNLLSRPRFRELLLAAGVDKENIMMVDRYPPINRGERIFSVYQNGMPMRKSSLVFKKKDSVFDLSPALL